MSFLSRLCLCAFLFSSNRDRGEFPGTTNDLRRPGQLDFASVIGISNEPYFVYFFVIELEEETS